MNELTRPRMKQLKRKRTLSEEVERELKNYIPGAIESQNGLPVAREPGGCDRPARPFTH